MITHYDLVAEDWVWNSHRKIYSYGGSYGKYKLERETSLVRIYEKDQSNVLYALVFKGRILDREALVTIMDMLGIKSKL